MVTATASFFVPEEGRRGYIMGGNGPISDFLNTQEEALAEAERLFFFGKITLEEYRELERIIRASSLPSDGATSDFCEPDQ